MEESYQIKYWRGMLEDTDAEVKNLYDKMQSHLSDAYAPYSGLHVVAGLILEDGSTHVGTNQENSVLPLGLCAERTALLSYPTSTSKSPILSIAVTCAPWEKNSLPLFPCGSCRQTIREFELRQGKAIKVYLIHPNLQVYRFSSGADLLPFSISNAFLENFQ